MIKSSKAKGLVVNILERFRPMQKQNTALANLQLRVSQLETNCMCRHDNEELEGIIQALSGEWNPASKELLADLDQISESA